MADEREKTDLAHQANLQLTAPAKTPEGLRERSEPAIPTKQSEVAELPSREAGNEHISPTPSEDAESNDWDAVERYIDEHVAKLSGVAVETINDAFYERLELEALRALEMDKALGYTVKDFVNAEMPERMQINWDATASNPIRSRFSEKGIFAECRNLRQRIAKSMLEYLRAPCRKQRRGDKRH